MSVKEDINVIMEETFSNNELSEEEKFTQFKMNLDRYEKNRFVENEPILDPSNEQFTVFPIRYPDIWNMYKKQVAAMWKAEEIDMSQDMTDFEMLNDNEQHFLKMILAFFAASDGIVNFNLSERFIRDVSIMEIQIAYAFQTMMENIHGETYSLMLNNIIEDKEEKEYLLNAIETVPAVKMMTDWAFKWIDSPKSFAHRVVAFAIVEGVFFSGAFAAIFWFKKQKNKGKLFMPGLIKANEFIARDEGMHCDFACMIYSHLENKLSEEAMYEIMDDAVSIADNFMTEALPCRLIGMNQESMSEYIRCTADRLLYDLGYGKLYDVSNPFDFMGTIGLMGKSNFFETRPTEYQDAYIMDTGNKSELVIADDF